MPLPDDADCSGQIWSSDLGAVRQVALDAGPWTIKRCDHSAYDHHWRLRIEVPDTLELEAIDLMRAHFADSDHRSQR